MRTLGTNERTQERAEKEGMVRMKETMPELVALLEETIALQAELKGKAFKFYTTRWS